MADRDWMPVVLGGLALAGVGFGLYVLFKKPAQPPEFASLYVDYYLPQKTDSHGTLIPGQAFGAQLSFRHKGGGGQFLVGIGIAYGEFVGHNPPFAYAMTKVTVKDEADWTSYTTLVNGIVPANIELAKLIDAQRFISKTTPVIDQQPPNDFGVNTWADEVLASIEAPQFTDLVVVDYTPTTTPSERPKLWPGGNFGAKLNFSHKGAPLRVWTGIGISYGAFIEHIEPFAFATQQVSLGGDIEWTLYEIDVVGVVPANIKLAKLIDAQRFISRTQPLAGNVAPDDFGINTWADEVYRSVSGGIQLQSGDNTVVYRGPVESIYSQVMSIDGTGQGPLIIIWVYRNKKWLMYDPADLVDSMLSQINSGETVSLIRVSRACYWYW